MPQGDGFVAIDLLGVERTDAIEWLEAERCLERLGLAYLAEPYELRIDSGVWIPVRLTDVSTDNIRLKTEDYGAVDAPVTTYDLSFPVPERLRQSR